MYAKNRYVNWQECMIWMDKSMNSISVGEWLTYLSQSKFVVCDSFHGTVFSILMHVRFWYWEIPKEEIRVCCLYLKLLVLKIA